MSAPLKFSCFIIGEGTLPVQCVEILWQRQHNIHGIISPDPLLKHWAGDKGIPYLEPSADLLAFVRQQPFDYLFSIVNHFVLPAEILTLPRRKAINYHDAPLPKYAGVHATSWAIMQQELTHGVTWHVMTEQVDAGDILKQSLFELTPDDTALTLNAKCYTAAIRSFTELVEELAEQRVLAQAQNLAEQTYFPLYQRPPAACLISWQQSAQQISAFVRALDFGPYPNELGLPKLALGSEFIAVAKLEILAAPSETPAGTLTAITADSLNISTTTQQVALRQLLTIDGQPLSIPEAVARFDLAVGDKFEALPATLAERLTTTYGRLCRHESFWVRQLAELQPLTVPFKATEPSASGHVSVSPLKAYSVPIPAEVVAFVKEHPAWRLDDFLLAVFALYLGRISASDHFDIGFSSVDLSHDIAELTGFFASRVPLRVTLDPARPFNQLYEAIRSQVDLVKQHVTYARDIMARYPQLGPIAKSGGRQVWPVSVDQVDNLADYQPLPGSELTLAIATAGSSPTCHCFYDSALFEETDVTAMFQQFTTLLLGLTTANAEQPLWALPLLTSTERQQLLVQWNNTDTAYPREQSIHQLFETQAKQTPDAVAIIFDDTALTYAELNQRANQLAHWFRKQGIGPEVGVGLCLERSLEMVIGILGILKAGGFYLPLDPAYPPDRLAFMAAEVQLPLLLTQKQLVSRLPEGRHKVICLDVDWPMIAQESRENPASEARPENLAYVMYTSGSTGQPKGVSVTHRNVVRLVKNTHYASLTAEEIFLQFAPISFDASTLELWGSLLNGGRLVVFPAYTPSLAELAQVLERHQITTLWLTAGLFQQMVEAHLESLVPVRQLLAGGDVLSVPHVKKVLNTKHTGQLINGYGPTENTTFTCCYPMTHLEQVGSSVSIGRPIANTRVYILDRFLQPVPVGVPGELYIGGEGLARGYFNRPDLTAEKFIPHPFSTEPGARLYRTGDLVRYRRDGAIEFLGRIDQQVKIRGFRIELGEIETVLAQHPAVGETAVLAREDKPGEKYLVAYVVPKRAGQPKPSEPDGSPGNSKYRDLPADLRHFLAKKLPDYMLPSTFVLLETLPLTANGKVDRHALPVPASAGSQTAAAYAPPRNPVEELLVDIWVEVLGLERAGINDNFFDLGGHSLMATQIISRIHKTFQVELPLRSLFERPTIAGLAEALVKSEAKPGQVVAIARLRQKLKGMSPDEIQAMLRDKKKA